MCAGPPSQSGAAISADPRLPKYRVNAGYTPLRATIERPQGLPRRFSMEEGKPIRRVVWGRRFLAATVVVPPSVAERLNTDALAVLAVIRDEAKATGRCDPTGGTDC
jgi:hypothetical protein